jgi:hypothetical protein
MLALVLALVLVLVLIRFLILIGSRARPGRTRSRLL